MSGTAADMLVTAGLASGFAKALTQGVCTLYFVAGAPAISKLFSRFFKKKNN